MSRRYSFLPSSVPAQTVRGGNGVTLPAPPVAAVKTVVDDYHGVKVEDPYQWLEDAKSPETRAWIDAENEYTQSYLVAGEDSARDCEAVDGTGAGGWVLRSQLCGGKYFFEKRLAEENQASIYMRDGWKGEDERLIDATKLSADQNTSVEHSGCLARWRPAGLRSTAGRRGRAIIHTMNVKKRKELADVLPPARYFGVSLSPGDKGLYYSRFTPHVGTTVWLHTFRHAARIRM